MTLDLTRLFEAEGEKQAFCVRLELPDVMRLGKRLFAGPVAVQGEAKNRSGIVSVSYRASFTPDVVCDRCLTPLTAPWEQEFSHIVVLSLNREDNDEFIVVPDGKLDLAELCTSDILLELPTTMVCDTQCKGLCPICGSDLNEGDCGCERKQSDPRLAKLRELLEEN